MVMQKVSGGQSGMRKVLALPPISNVSIPDGIAPVHLPFPLVSQIAAEMPLLNRIPGAPRSRPDMLWPRGSSKSRV